VKWGGPYTLITSVPQLRLESYLQTINPKLLIGEASCWKHMCTKKKYFCVLEYHSGKEYGVVEV
jgi:hypothetical protein